ncbi:MAG: CvpA family protein [Eubacteriales bacterium]
MSSVLDIILIAIVVLFAVIGAKRGFVKSVSGFVSHIASFIITLIFYKKAALLVKKLPFIAAMITDIEMPEFSSGSGGFLDKINTVINYIISSDDISQTSKAVVNNLLADIISTIIAFALVFTCAILLMKLIFFLLGFITEAPVIKQANGALGLLFGILSGFFWAWIAANIFGNILFPVLNAKWPDIFITHMLDSVIYTICTKINPMTYIFMAIQKLSGK